MLLQNRVEDSFRSSLRLWAFGFFGFAPHVLLVPAARHTGIFFFNWLPTFRSLASAARRILTGGSLGPAAWTYRGVLRSRWLFVFFLRDPVSRDYREDRPLVAIRSKINSSGLGFVQYVEHGF